MIISLIVAVAENGVIGKDNSLPWHLPADMKYFRDTTMGHCVIMGRKNYESIPVKYRPLKGRTNIIITRQNEFSAPGCIVVNSLEDALEKAKNTPSVFGNKNAEVFIIGGADVFRQALPLANKIYYTKIHYPFEGNVHFPPLDEKKWKLVSKQDVFPDENNKYPFSFCVYEKVQ
jgi:dihydrofolate reductase